MNESSDYLALRVIKLESDLKALLIFLDEEDENDRFGTEGWRHAIGWEDYNVGL